MKYHFKIHKEGTGFWAQCLELQGCITEADTLDSLYENMKLALNLYVDEPENKRDVAPLPDETIRLSKTVVEVPLDPEIAFAFLVRYYRVKRGITQEKAAKMMGFDQVFSYQRLESSRCNPSLKMLCKIKQVFPEISIDKAMNNSASHKRSSR